MEAAAEDRSSSLLASHSDNSLSSSSSAPLPVLIRHLRRVDLPSLKALDAALFPVRYNDVFYEGLLRDPAKAALVAAHGGSGELLAVAICD